MAQIEAAEIDRRLSDPELCENTAVARSALGAHRYRPDHFKGFAREQVAQLLKENDTLVEENYAAKSEEKQIDDDYDASQAELLRLATTRKNVIDMNAGQQKVRGRRRRPARGERERRRKATAPPGAIAPGGFYGSASRALTEFAGG